MKRTIPWLMALCMVLSGCGGTVEPTPEVEEEVVETVVPLPEPEPTPEPEPDPYVLADMHPLTGLELGEDNAKNRPIAVMLNNYKAALPQLGVSQADIIYEVPAEGGITRMLAIFQSVEDVGNLGSIRSARHYYIELVLGHDALYVHAGGSPQAYEYLSTYHVDNMDGVNGGSDQSIFWRDADRRASAGYEHSMLTSGSEILDYLEGGRYETQREDAIDSGLVFHPDGTTFTQTATDISVKFSNYKTATFTYQEGLGYAVGQYGADYTDGNSGDTVVVPNVLVLESNIWAIAGDTAGRLDMNLSGYSGSGWYFCGGKATEIGWDKADINSPLTYTTAAGEPLTMTPGQLYVCIVDQDSHTLQFT